MLTAFSQREVIEQARDAGALAYLVKPFQKSDLIPAIEVAIGRFRELQDLDGEVDALGEQLEARKIIDRAKGMLIDECGLREQDAFTFIQRTAMSERTRCARSPSGSSPARCARDDRVKLLLLDGNSLTYRAFFALPTDMATASGQVTNAVFGFTSMLINLLKDHQPDGIMVAFDRPEPTFRHEQQRRVQGAARGGARHPPPADGSRPPGARGAARSRSSSCAGWEADDIIATVAEQAKADGHDVIIVTGDRDAYQLVDDPHVKVLYNRRGVSDYALYDEAGIFEKTGVTPAQYVEYAALRGDPSDNLPGVPGVGEKTAAKLINTYGGLDGIFANVDEQTPKLRAVARRARGRGRGEHAS